MTAKYHALRKLLQQTPKSLAAVKKLESWGSGVDLTDSNLLELATLLPRADVRESLSRLKNAIKFADGLPPAQVLSVQETIDRDPWAAVANLRQMRSEPGEPEPQNPWQAIIDKDPENAPALLGAVAMAGREKLNDRDLQARRAEPKPRENLKPRNWAN